MKLILLYIRTLSRFKVYTVINIIGLALSLACVIIIFRYVKQENDVDCYSPNKDRIGIMVQEYKDDKTRSHTDGFQRNNAKCLDEKGISRFVPHSSI